MKVLVINCGSSSLKYQLIDSDTEELLAACLPIALVGLVSAMHQGKTAVSAVGIVAKKPDQFGKAMLFPAMVETYAILALLVSILAINGVPV